MPGVFFFEVDLWAWGDNLYLMMKYTKFIVAGMMCSLLSSCALVQSVLRTPGTLLRSVGRTTGFNVNNEELNKSGSTDIIKLEEKEEMKIY